MQIADEAVHWERSMAVAQGTLAVDLHFLPPKFSNADSKYRFKHSCPRTITKLDMVSFITLPKFSSKLNLFKWYVIDSGGYDLKIATHSFHIYLVLFHYYKLKPMTTI